MSSVLQSRPPSRRPTPAVVAWGSVGLVLVIVVVLIVVKVTSGSGPIESSHQAVRPASPTLVREVSSVPLSVFNAVGVGIPSGFAGSAPIVVAGQPALSIDGKAPSMLYFGAEYCPYCAAERWGIAVALARFGTWHDLDTTASGLSDGDFSTLSFRSATLTSRFLHFVPIETCTNIVDPSASGCGGYKPLQAPTRAEQGVLDRYARPPFVPDDKNGISFPYIDVGNKVLFSGSTYQPEVLTGLSQSEIAGELTDASNPVTQAIVGTANYLTAAVCSATSDSPSSVCTSPGVRAAAAALKNGASHG